MVTAYDLGAYTFPALFRHSVTHFKERNALGFVNGQVLTYAQTEQRSKQASSILHTLGIREKDKVALYSANCPNWGAAYFAVVNSGAIAVPLLPDFTELEVKNIAEHAGLAAVIVSEKLALRLKDIPPSLIRSIIRMEDYRVLRQNGKDILPDAENVIDIHTQGLAGAPQVQVDENDTASIIYTSGTTGRSKGVELTHKNLVFTAVQCQTVHRVNKRDKCLSFLPLSHVYEFTIGFVMQFLNGACVYYLEKAPAVSTLLPAFKKIRPTIVLSVPMIIEKIYKNKILPLFSKNAFVHALYRRRFFQKILHRLAGSALKKTFGGRIKFFGIGGAKTDPVVEIFMKDAHFPYAVGYGLTETSPLLAGSNPKNTIPGTIGPVLQGVELRVINADSKTGIGEIVARGNNVMKGYYKEPDLTAAAFTTEKDECGAGWFKTGDLGELRNGIWLSLKGRLKNMILGSGGENVYPEDIEFVLNQHPDVVESLVVEDDDGLVALVQLNEEKLKTKGILNSVSQAVEDIKENLLYKQEAVLSEIKYFVNTKVNRFSKVDKVKPVNSFEKTASQKIKRYLYNLRTGKKK
ncbi:MAG: AMP-binding protein [Treponema lecithinolyticum]|uniref:AMP-binding protein n=1 Tax=Treponema lecithinolyticum TaxID=53418 RepID=UPI0036127B4D